MKRVFVFSILLTLLVACSGCGDTTMKAVQTDVSGTVTLDGKPMPDGEISFVLPGLPPSVLPIKNGAFSGKAGAGENKVEISAYKAGAALDMGDQKFEGSKENYIPAKYNSESKMTANLKAGAPNSDLKFEATSE